MEPWLSLAVAEGYGQTPPAALLDPDADPEWLLAAPDSLPPAVRRRLRDPGLPAAARAVRARAEALGLEVVTPGCRRYPDALRHAPLRPLVLFARGNLGLLDRERPAVAVVGSRTPTPYGTAAAEDFAGALAAAGVVIWSGLAIGIDAVAHRAALAADTPTVAVLAGGLDRVYPDSHRDVAAEIERRGLLLSEAPPGRRARRGHFPRRNRILAGCVDAVLVVEAGAASGSLHTARFAAEVGVPVFAVPGPYRSPRSQGCHALIADGACVARDPEDLLRRLGVEDALQGGHAELELGADEAAIVAVLRRGPRPQDLIRREARLETDRYLRAVLALTRKGLVRPLPGDALALAGLRSSR